MYPEITSVGMLQQYILIENGCDICSKLQWQNSNAHSWAYVTLKYLVCDIRIKSVTNKCTITKSGTRMSECTTRNHTLHFTPYHTPLYTLLGIYSMYICSVNIIDSAIVYKNAHISHLTSTYLIPHPTLYTLLGTYSIIYAVFIQ